SLYGHHSSQHLPSFPTRRSSDLDPAPLNMTETVVNLKPASAWRPGMTREKLIGELDQAAALPGVANIWTQPIINRINMLTTGIRSEEHTSELQSLRHLVCRLLLE